jgi:hypothetical protein
MPAQRPYPEPLGELVEPRRRVGRWGGPFKHPGPRVKTRAKRSPSAHAFTKPAQVLIALARPSTPCNTGQKPLANLGFPVGDAHTILVPAPPSLTFRLPTQREPAP